MNAFRQIIRSENGKLLIEIPKEYNNQQQFEVILLPFDESVEKEHLQRKIDSFLATLPDSEPQITDEEILLEIKKVRAKRYA